MGCFIAKSILDGRLLDLPLSSALLKWMIGKPLTMEDFRAIYPDRYHSPSSIHTYIYSSFDKLLIYEEKRDQILASTLVTYLMTSS